MSRSAFAGRPRLLDRLRAAMRIRHYSPRTEAAYIGWVRRFVRYHGLRHPNELGPDAIAAFLTHLATDGKVSASTQNQALAALLFLYAHVIGRPREDVGEFVRARRSVRLPVVLSAGEVEAVLGHMRGKPALMATLLYGSGLRLMECATLRIKDVDFALRQVVVRGGKGAKDRVAPLPSRIESRLRAHLEDVKRQHEMDLKQGAGWVEVPIALGRKYPNAGREWPWQWVFPATRLYRHRESGQRRRHHFHETALQRAVHAAGLALRPLTPRTSTGSAARRAAPAPPRSARRS